MIKIDKRIETIMNLFENKNEQIYIVGGAVRDFLLNLVPIDYDLTTSALPQTIKNILKDFTLDLKGEHFGSFSFIIDELNIQVTTMRKEEYKNVHYPNEIKFTTSLKEDLKRRDFTINAICYRNNKIIDLYNGLNDLNNKTVELIGDKSIRFKEDPLRIIRALRFAINLDLKIEIKTLFYIKEDFNLIYKLNKIKIKNELNKIRLQKNTNNKLKDLILPLYNYTI